MEEQTLSERYRNKLQQRVDERISIDGVLLQLEVTNACNHRCYFCPNSRSERKKQMMDLEFARRIIQECSELLGKDKRICFHMNGEPLLYNDLKELIRLSKDKGFEYCFLTTNGALASEDMLTDLFEAGLDSIKFSINAGTRETYEKIHGKDDFQKAIEAVRFSAKYRNEKRMKFKIYVSCVATKDNYEELIGLNSLVEEYCDEIVFYYPCHYAGQMIERAEELRYDLKEFPLKVFDIVHVVPCPVLWNSINVTCEGYLALCCSESDNRLIVEDLNKTTIKEAWFGEKMKEIRNKHIRNEIFDLPCYSCVSGEKYHEKEMNKAIMELSLSVRGGLYDKIHF